MEITCPIHPTPSFPPFSPSGSSMRSSSPETAPPTPPCIPTSALPRLSWHGPNLLLYLPHVKVYVSFYFSLHQRPLVFLHRGLSPFAHCGFRFTIRLRPDDFCEPPIADPHDGWCGEGRLNTAPYPIRRWCFSSILQ